MMILLQSGITKSDRDIQRESPQFSRSIEASLANPIDNNWDDVAILTRIYGALSEPQTAV